MREVVVVLRGELDLATAPKLAERLRAILPGANRVVFDLACLEFIDCAGIRPLVDGASILAPPAEVRLRSPSRLARRIFEIIKLGDIIEVQPPADDEPALHRRPSSPVRHPLDSGPVPHRGLRGIGEWSLRSHRSAFSLVFSRALGRVVVHVHGELDQNTAPELKDRLADIIDSQGNRNLVLDLRAMTGVDFAGLSTVVDALKRMGDHGGEMVLVGPVTRNWPLYPASAPETPTEQAAAGDRRTVVASAGSLPNLLGGGGGSSWSST